jgi:hypothetical protein
MKSLPVARRVFVVERGGELVAVKLEAGGDVGDDLAIGNVAIGYTPVIADARRAVMCRTNPSRDVWSKRKRCQAYFVADCSSAK